MVENASYIQEISDVTTHHATRHSNDHADDVKETENV